MKKKKIIATLLSGAVFMGAAFSGCGNVIRDDAVFATLDDTTITMGVANFFAKYQQAMFDSIYSGYFGEDMWDNDLYGNGNTLTEDVKEDVAEELQTLYLLKAHMGDYDISISEEEEAAIGKAVDDFLADNSSAAIKQIGAGNRENAVEMLRLQTIRHKMHERIIQDADTAVTDEEAAQRTFSYLQIDTSGYTDEEQNHVDYTDEEKEQFKTTAESIASAEDFETAVTDAGYTLSTASYGSAEDEDASLDVAVLEAADVLSEGEVSKVVETDSAYYVVRLDKEFDEEATASKKEEMVSEKQEEYYDNMIDEWKEASEWKINESEWAKVTFEDHFSPIQEDETESLGEATESLDTATESLEGNAQDTEAAPEE